MPQQLLFIRSSRALHKIALPNIVYIQAMDDYVHIHLKEGKLLVTRVTMKELLKQLDPAKFIRVHRSFIVPLGEIASVSSKKISIPGIDIPVGDTYVKSVLAAFKN